MLPTNLPIEGLVHLTGEPDTGKTTLTLTVPGVQPSEIIFFDDDKKTQPIADALARSGTPFGYYVNLERATVNQDQRKPLEFWKLVQECLSKAKKDVPKAKVLVFDNFDRMEVAIRAYSMSIMESISDMTPGQIKGMSQMTWPYTFAVYAQFLDTLNTIAPLVFVCTHIREKYLNNVKTGIMEAKGQRALVEKANMRAWLRHSKNGPAPTALFLKRIQRMQVTAEGLVPINVLPRRLDPCTWKTIIQYLNDPIGERQPTPEETPNDFELSILDGVLTKDQKDVLRAARIQAEQEARGDSDMPLNPMILRAKELQEQGYMPPQIASEMGVSVPEVIRMLQ